MLYYLNLRYFLYNFFLPSLFCFVVCIRLFSFFNFNIINSYLPLYFASSGLKTDVAKIRGAEAWGLLVLVISTACAGKILGTFAVAMMFMMPVRESLTLGVLMNTKGLVELIVLNIGKEKKVSSFLRNLLFSTFVFILLDIAF